MVVKKTCKRFWNLSILHQVITTRAIITGLPSFLHLGIPGPFRFRFSTHERLRLFQAGSCASSNVLLKSPPSIAIDRLLLRVHFAISSVPITSGRSHAVQIRCFSTSSAPCSVGMRMQTLSAFPWQRVQTTVSPALRHLSLQL